MDIFDEIENNKKSLLDQFAQIKNSSEFRETYANIYVDNCSYSPVTYYLAIKMFKEQYLGNARIEFQNNINLPEYRKDVDWVNESMLLTFEKKRNKDDVEIILPSNTDED